MKLSNQQVALDTLLLAGVSDKLSLLLWYNSKDAKKGSNQPQSLVEILTNHHKESTRQELVFSSGEEFEKARQAILKGGG